MKNLKKILPILLLFTLISCSTNSEVQIPEFYSLELNNPHYISLSNFDNDSFLLTAPVIGWTSTTIAEDQKTMDFDILNHTITCEIENTRKKVTFSGEDDAIKVDFTIAKNGTFTYHSASKILVVEDNEQSFVLVEIFSNGKIEEDFFNGQTTTYFSNITGESKHYISRLWSYEIENYINEDGNPEISFLKDGQYNFSKEIILNNFYPEDIENIDFEEKFSDIDKVYYEEPGWKYTLINGNWEETN